MINIQGLKAKISEKGVVKGTANNKIVYEKLENIEELIDDINNEVIEGTAPVSTFGQKNLDYVLGGN